MKDQMIQSIEQFLYKKSQLCDQQKWDEYLELFDENSMFHIPQWDSEHVYTTDPKTEMSLIYYPTRAGLEDRVYRIRTGKSAACTPMPRTMHQISNVQLESVENDVYRVSVNWSTHFVRFGESGCFFGWASYELRQVEGGWIILNKQAIVLNDKIRHVLDFYHV